MQQVSDIQKLRESQFALDQIKKNILYINEHYDIRFACLDGSSEDIRKSSIKKGYFKVSESYNTLEEALDYINGSNRMLISGNQYMVGGVYENLQDALPGTIYNLYTGWKVADVDPIPACDLDGVRNPISFMKLYNEVSESVPELKDVLENIEIPSIDPNLDCRQWITETWNTIHESLDISEENRVIKGIAYTDFII